MAQHNTKTPAEDKDSWRTPPWLFEWLNARFSFDQDARRHRRRTRGR